MGQASVSGFISKAAGSHFAGWKKGLGELWSVFAWVSSSDSRVMGIRGDQKIARADIEDGLMHKSEQEREMAAKEKKRSVFGLLDHARKGSRGLLC